MKRVYAIAIAFVVALLAAAGWYFRDGISAGHWGLGSGGAADTSRRGSSGSSAANSGAADGSKIVVEAPSDMTARSGAGAAGAGSAALAPLPPPVPEKLRPEHARMGDVLYRRNFTQAIADAAASDDPQLNALALQLIDFCAAHTTVSAKAQTGAGGPPPTSLRAKTASGAADSVDQRRVDNARWIAESCKDFTESGAQGAAETALTKLNAKGSSTSAVFGQLTSQLDYRALSSAQFAAVNDALTEKNMPLLALMGAQIAPALTNAFVGGNVSEAAASSLAWQLALCQMGAYCGRDSLALREACWQFGACAGDDLPSAVRAALDRDGLPGNALDQQVRLFVKAINTHDPDVLIIRRK